MFQELEQFLCKTIHELSRIDRWRPYVEAGATSENDLEHSFSTVLLSIVVLELLDMRPPPVQYDKYEILACAALHDIGEIGIGDTLYREKNAPTTEGERQSFLSQVGGLPEEMRTRLYTLYMVQYQDDSRPPADIRYGKEGSGSTLVFEFIERTGYLLYAIGEYRKSADNIPLLVHVLRNQLTRIEELLHIFPSGRVIFTDQVIVGLREILKENFGKYIEALS